jgi:hypothetical protein
MVRANGTIDHAAVHAAARQGVAAFRGLNDEAAINRYMRLQYMRIFGTEVPSSDQKIWADNILAAIYGGEGRMNRSMLITTDPAAGNGAFARDLLAVQEAMREMYQRQGVNFANSERTAALLRLMQGENGIPATTNPGDLREILRTAHLALADGRTPEQALATVRNFMQMARESGNTDHLRGLSFIYEQAEERMRQEFQRSIGRPWESATPSQRARWMQEVQRNPEIRETVRLAAINENLQQARRSELQAQGKPAAEIDRTLAQERAARETQAREMNACQGGGGGRAS